ncbi:nucleotidyltransferase domain-containing protein [Parasphingorhabdus cellanae]|uniref:Nucleotidyltransferase family protein n=1 Tax=Parasphingorhabdus cellanae TaxID=2806553 RepID=A0ABX7TAE2_9SPHN|nr:nucleotidyltransferase family protein [Parasphingorhabdus cellanae]QTD57677.1 nucleotidyltransferase family protein [Parasphingorhabdus cellanae]
MRNAQPLVDALRKPETVLSLDRRGWTELISIARAESLIGSLAHRLTNIEVPEQVKPVLKDAIQTTDLARLQALWEADSAQRALVPLNCKTVLMKGTAYVAADLDAGIGRSIGDLDIMVARDQLPAAEEALLDAGWEWVKPDAYDDQYYRDHMHELPPLIHRERDRMIDVHHTTLPLTAGPTPNAQAMLDASVRLDSGLYVMAPADMLLHSVAHLFADGDLAGGLRNLWDIDRLVRRFSESGEEFWAELGTRAKLHQLVPHLARALRLAVRLYGTPVYKYRAGQTKFTDYLYIRRLLARDGWGRETRKFTRQAFYIRSHWLRMPPLMLMQHLWTKWRKA